jgi:hypothetical protein
MHLSGWKRRPVAALTRQDWIDLEDPVMETDIPNRDTIESFLRPLADPKTKIQRPRLVTRRAGR